MKKYLGIEFGSTRIKGVLLDEDHVIIARGSYLWENQLVNGIWTYPLSLAFEGLQACYRELKENFRKKTGEKLTHIDAIGISGMMHGYLVFDKGGKQIREFRTWRNTITEEASNILSQAFCFHIPQRWSACHIYQAILNKEEGVKDIAFATTLAGYFHYLLTGEKVLGIGEASGVFPIDGKTRDYHQGMLTKFNALVEKEVPWKLIDILPKILLAGDDAGYLSQQGALLIDPEGDLKPGVPFCPPEGDMGTGMICTNSLRPGTGNASIGTSSNVTIITDAEIGVYPEIDVITTPTGVNAALVHINNGTSEMNVWERLFKEVVGHFAPEVKDGDLYSLMFNAAMKGDKAVKGLYSVDFFSGEPVAEVNEGKLLSIREPDAEMSLTNFMRSHIYSLLAPIRLGVDILTEKEGIKLKKIVGHGGFFKTPKVGEIMLSSAFNVPVLTLVSAGEGGPYGQALLAAYRLEKASGESLEDYLENKVFRHQKANEYQAEEADVRGFESFLKDYKKALEIEKHAIASFSQKKDSALSLLKEEVLRANLRLAEEGLVTLTWGNVSLIDREKGLVVIKPSGVPYEKLKAEDMVVVDLEGRVVEGRLKPSSDTPTHLALYKAFPEISSIVHTHSTYAVSWAQAAKAIPVYGTTHADTFSLPIPCTRDLRKNEIEGDYETNTGKVIAETFQGKDPLAVPGVLVAHHGPFAWGRSAKEAVDHALILEKVAEMAVLTKAIDPESSEVGENLLKKHYERKHGKNAYYGQGGNHE